MNKFEQDAWDNSGKPTKRINREEMHPTEAQKYRVKVGTLVFNSSDYGQLLVHYWRAPDSKIAYINKVYQQTTTHYTQWPSMGRYTIMDDLHNKMVTIDPKEPMFVWLSGIYAN